MTKQTILVYSTKLMILTFTIPLVKTIAMSLILYGSPNTLINLVETKPIMVCTLLDGTNTNMLNYFAMFQIVLFKIILVLSPATFIGMNTLKTKYICLGHLVISIVYIVGHVIIFGNKCISSINVVLF